MTSQFHPAAREEFIATVEYYEAARSGLGQLFRDAVLRAIARLEAFPASGSERRGAQRSMVEGFPYDVVYRERSAILEILALAHHRRRPGYWKRRA